MLHLAQSPVSDSGQLVHCDPEGMAGLGPVADRADTASWLGQTTHGIGCLGQLAVPLGQLCHISGAGTAGPLSERGR